MDELVVFEVDAYVGDASFVAEEHQVAFFELGFVDDLALEKLLPGAARQVDAQFAVHPGGEARAVEARCRFDAAGTVQGADQSP